jgi:hypothetical protein
MPLVIAPEAGIKKGNQRLQLKFVIPARLARLPQACPHGCS